MENAKGGMAKSKGEMKITTGDLVQETWHMVKNTWDLGNKKWQLESMEATTKFNKLKLMEGNEQEANSTKVTCFLFGTFSKKESEVW
jgi:hypothetical protein